MNIGIVHYRVGRTDGVSLEIEKRRKLLTSMGHSVRLISGSVSNGADMIIPELEFDTEKVIQIKENAFLNFNRRDMTANELMHNIDSLSSKIFEAFMRYTEKYHFDALLLHNIFSHGRHIAAAKAFADIAEKLQIPILATHHDFYWERKEYQLASYPEIDEYLAHYVPYAGKNIKQICINSLTAEELFARRKIKPDILPDTFDFSSSPWLKDAFNADLPEQADFTESDLIVLQATRIVQRKGIELAIHLVRQLQEKRSLLIDRKLYNGKVFRNSSRIILLLPGYTEKASVQYEKDLRRLAAELKIEVRFIAPLIGARRVPGSKKIYSLWDTYAFADLITFPSLSEGWGNQFIEAVFAKRPVAVFEYPVFKADIRPENYHYISLGDQTAGTDPVGLQEPLPEIIEQASVDTLETLLSPETNQLLAKNFETGRKYHDLQILRDCYTRYL
jgi:glycosyltransferase involved in cell wall biosynthesis